MIAETDVETIKRHDDQIKLLTSAFADMTTINTELRNNAQTVIDTGHKIQAIFEAVETTLKFFVVVAKIAKWLTIVGGAIALVWAIIVALKTGTVPPIHIGMSDHHDG